MANEMSLQEMLFPTQSTTETREEAQVGVGQLLFPDVDLNAPEAIPSKLDEFTYGFDSTPSFTNNIGLVLESYMPMGALFTDEGFYSSPEELYGEGFMSLSQEERRKVLLAKREEDLLKEYPVLSRTATDSDSLSKTIGSVAGILLDPINLTPVGSSIKAVSAISGGLGVGYSVAEDLAQEGVIDPKKAAITGGVSALAGAGIAKGLQVLSNKLSAAKSSSALKEANNTVDKINAVAARSVVNDVPVENIPSIIQRELSLSPDDVIKVAARADKRIVYPSKDAAKAMFEVSKNGTDEVARTKNPFFDNLLGTLSTRVRNISEPIAHRLRAHEFNVHANTQKVYDEVTPLLNAMGKVPSNLQKRLAVQLGNGDFDSAIALMSKYSPDVDQSLANTRVALDNVFKELKKVGYEIDAIENYFPRQVKDLDGLRKKLDAPRLNLIDKALLDRARGLGLNTASDLPAEESEKIINQVIRGYKPKVDGAKLSFSKSRVLPEITEDITEFYEKPAVALSNYIRSAVNDIERRRFLGRDIAVNKTGTTLDTEASVGNFIQKEVALGNLSATKGDELVSLLQARFGLGEKGPAQSIRALRNLGYATTLANPLSALVQIGDIGLSAYMNGMGNTIRAILGKSKITMQELGLDNVIAQELNSVTDTSAALHKLFGYSGFRAVDRFGKNVNLNAALNKGNRFSKTEKGQQALAKKYKNAFGDEEFAKLINELKSGEMSDRVKLYLWNELSDVQPISLSEVPTSYLNSPNGRILYALKTYSIKQLDLLRRDIVQQYKKGNKAEATKNLVRYLAIVPLVGGTVEEVRDFALGRGFELEDIVTDNAPENVLKTFGANEYVRQKYLSQGKVSEAIVNTLTPPLAYIDAVTTDMFNLLTSGDVVPEETLREMPIIGRLWYNFFGGGLESWKDWNKD